MMHRRFLAVLAGIVGTAALPAGVGAGSQQPGPAAKEAASDYVESPVIARSLGPGLTVLMSPDRSASSLASCLVLPGGSRAERLGETGLAELSLAHVLANTPGLPMPQSGVMLAARGASLSSSVEQDTASLCVTLPARELPLAMWLAARRLRTAAPSLDVAEALAPDLRQSAQRRLDGAAELAGAVKLEQLAFQGYPSMDAPPVAAASRLELRNLASAPEFFARQYQRSSVVLSLVGRFDQAQAEQLARQYLGKLGPRKAGVGPRVAEEPPPHTSDRYAMMFHKEASRVGLHFGWVGPEVGTKDHAALTLANAVLALGDSSRLSDRLIRRNRWVKSVSGSVQRFRGPELFSLSISMAKRIDPDAVAQVVAEEIRRLGAQGPSVEELERSRALLEKEHLQRLDSPLDRARVLGQSWLNYGRCDGPERELAASRGVTPEEVRQAVSKHLGQYQLTTVEVYPPDYPVQPSSAPMKRYYLVRRGDTLIGIAKVHGVSVDALVKVNGVKRKSPIFPGQKLVIPTGGKRAPKPITHTVKKGDSLIGIAKKHGVTVREITQANGISRKKPIIVGQALTIPPKNK